jgi:TolB-like protein/Flp pilus assembly protein TadD
MIQLGSTVFDRSAQMLRDSAGAKIALRAQSARVLDCLVQANGALVTKEQLFKTVWADVAVTDDSLVQCIREIRTAIGDLDHAVLQTETRRGYRLLANGHDSTWMNGTVSMPAALSPSIQTADKLTVPAIAVMAFTSMEGDERSERLAVTFAGDLLAELARHKELRLIGRFSSFSLRDQALTSTQVCDKLGARYIVSGQVQFTETQIDWSLEMMDGHNNELVWSERKRVKFLDLYVETTALISRLTGAIVTNLGAFTYRKSMTMAPESLNAYDLCARAYSVGTRDTPDSVLEAQQLAGRAVALYPQLALAWRTLAAVHSIDIVLCQTGQWTDAHIPQALKEVHKAIELDATQAFAHGVLANLLAVNGQHQEALVAAEHAVSLAPSDPMMLHLKSTILFYAGKFAESKALSEHLLSFGTLRQTTQLVGYGRTLFAMGEHAQAIHLLQEALNMSPGFNTARLSLIAALEETQQHAPAVEHYALLLRYSHGFIENHFGRRWSATPALRERYVAALRAHGAVIPE